jgi:hypothetical protein
MHFTHIIALATVALSSAAAVANPEASAYAELADVQSKLDAAILVGRSMLANPHAAHDAPAKRVADYLSAAFEAAENKRDLSAIAKPALERRDPNNWCHFVGQGCGKVRRSAEAVQEILGEPALQKRIANNWCHFVGQGCGKTKRSIDQLLSASEEILTAYPQ